MNDLQENISQAEEICEQLRNKKLLVVNPRRKNGLIIYKKYHAEFAGPGAVAGSSFDLDVKLVIPVGNLSLITPKNSQERQRAYLIRRQWVRLTKQITDSPEPKQRAKMVINQFEHYFGSEIVCTIPDEAFARLVGVLPQTVAQMRDDEERKGLVLS